jgi:pimeloyl-ACP methyl ester carboxylesterase
LGFLKEHEVSGSLVSFPSQNVKLFLRKEGTGSPILLMHGRPGADHSTLLPLLPLSASHTLIFYDHRCNRRSHGADVETMTWNNVVEDAEAIRNYLGFAKWAVVGHSFGGMVALEYAIRHSEKRIRGARLQIVRCAGHNVHMERPDETRAPIAGFVQR